MQKDLSRQKVEKIRQKLKERLSLNNLHNEIKLITNMNKQLEITIDCMKKMDILSQLSKEEIVQVINGISFLKLIRNKNSNQECVRIEYENAHRQLLVTGIQRQFVEDMIIHFNSYSNFNRRQIQQSTGKPQSAKILQSNKHWITIETSSQEAASLLKKCLRNEKRNLDQNPSKNNYKIERRRIRIIIVKEDLFTLLIDAMTEYKAQMFHKNFILLPSQTLERRKSQQLSNSFPEVYRSPLLYRPLLYNNIQNSNIKNDPKQQQFSDGFSESNSLSSEIIDGAKMKDLIETSDQGIQSQNNILVQNQQKIIYSSQNNSPQKQPYSAHLSIQQQRSKTSDDKSQQLSEQTETFKSTQNEQTNKIFIPEDRLQALISNQDLLCTQKHSPVYKKGQFSKASSLNGQLDQKLFKESYCQTDQGLYTVISNAQMRRLLQQFKNRSHSDFIELPDWMKSESQNERNRHRFFSSLCKPKLIRQRKIQ